MVVKEVVIHPHHHQPLSTEDPVAAVVEMTPLAVSGVSKPDQILVVL